MDIFAKCLKDKTLKEVKKARLLGYYPYFIPFDRLDGSRVWLKNKPLLMAGSNNYLGLSFDPRVKEAALKALENYGTSCSGSRFLNGTIALHEELEKKLAKFLGRKKALCFSTGYQTNLGAISALLATGDHIFTDRYNHASIMDGIFLAEGLKGKIHVHRYKHNDPQSLEKALASVPLQEPKLIVTDGVFSMEGDIVKLPQLKELAQKYKARLYLDEAHALGVVGKTGRGTEEHWNLAGACDIIMCTFSKSFGSLGGFIAGDADIVDFIKHSSRPLIFSASIPPANLAAVNAALDIIIAEPQRVKRLQEIARFMLKSLTEAGFEVGKAETPIIPLITGNRDLTLKFWHTVLAKGVYTNVVLPPAVPPDRCLIRTSYMAIHTDEELKTIVKVLVEAGRKHKILK